MMRERVQTIKTLKTPLLTQPMLTVVIPIRNTSGWRIRNCIRSLKIQSLESFTTIIADYGSSTKDFEQLMRDLENFDCSIYRCSTERVWSLSIARNMGIQRAMGKIVVTVDSDLIFEPNVLSTIVEQHGKLENPFVVSTVCNIYENVRLKKIRLPEDYVKFRNCRQRPGRGGVMSAPRDWWHKVRGFDERMKGWGAEDDDMWARAGRDKRDLLDIQSLKLPNIKVYHQWHPIPFLIRTKQISKEKYKELWRMNKNIWKGDETIIRNDEKWGLSD